MDYKQKLIQFNDTPKYKTEADFLLSLVSPRPKENILDYGTGLGRLVYRIREQYQADAYGYDFYNYREKDDPYYFRPNFYFRFDKAYFMHSIAHVPNIESKLITLKELLKPGATVTVITPNAQWIEELPAREYTPDPTVIKHFTISSLTALFMDFGYTVTLSGQFGEVVNGYCERIFLQARNEG